CRPYLPGGVAVVAIVAALAMVLGVPVAIVRSSVRRLLAYSAIAHDGYMLLAVLSPSDPSLAALSYYVITYGLTTLGAFGVVAIVQQSTGTDRLSDFAGLRPRAPVVSFCMLIFMLSLAGSPPLVGFCGNFFVFSSALSAGPKSLGLLWLVILALAMSAVSLYYYLQVLKQIFIVEPNTTSAPSAIPMSNQILLALVAL